jgi:hypothetical protein
MALLAVAVPARAQTGGIVGHVIDESGAIVRGASVTLVGPNTRDINTSGANGEYRFENLVAGTYQISVTRSGFSPARLDTVIVGDAVVTVPPIELSVAGVADTLVVSAKRSSQC